jgi:hypothetical protein
MDSFQDRWNLKGDMPTPIIQHDLSFLYSSSFKILDFLSQNTR